MGRVIDIDGLSRFLSKVREWAGGAFVSVSEQALTDGQKAQARANIGLTAGDGVSLSDAGAVSVDSTVVRTTGAQSVAGSKRFTNQILVGGPGVTVFTGMQTARKCADDGDAVNCAGFFVNRDGKAKLVHRRGGESADDDACLVFDATGMWFSGSGTPGAQAVADHMVWHAGNLSFDGTSVVLSGGVVSAALKTVGGVSPDANGDVSFDAFSVAAADYGVWEADASGADTSGGASGGGIEDPSAVIPDGDIDPSDVTVTQA